VRRDEKGKKGLAETSNNHAQPLRIDDDNTHDITFGMDRLPMSVSTILPAATSTGNKRRIPSQMVAPPTT